MRQAATRVEDKEYELFLQTASNIGTTAADALRMFIYAFNDHHGFPYPVQSRRMQVEAFDNEEDATRFATDLAMEALQTELIGGIEVSETQIKQGKTKNARKALADMHETIDKKIP